jgi:hypothetical protein
MGESALGLIAYLITAGLVVVVLFLWIRQQLRLAYSSDQIRNSDPRHLAGSASGAMEGWMHRTAQCCCGSLQARVSGDPVVVSMCHCEQCQRRTGSAFGVAAYFKEDQVRVSGPSTVFVRDGQDGRKLTQHFCPRCGSTVYWFADIRPGHIGVALGTFFDPHFPPPVRSVWELSKHDWIAIGSNVQHFPKNGSGPVQVRSSSAPIVQL